MNWLRKLLIRRPRLHVFTGASFKAFAGIKRMFPKGSVRAWLMPDGSLTVVASPDAAARALAMHRHRQERQRVHDVCDELRRKHNLPPIDWTTLTYREMEGG